MNSFTRLRAPMLALVIVTLAACTTTRVRTDANAAASVSACRTYGWIEPTVGPSPSNSAFANPINDQRLRTAVAQRLAAKGIRPAESGAAPDCLVSHAIGTRENFAGNNGRARFSFGIGTGRGYGSGTTGSVFVNSSDPYAYREGRIAVDLFKSNREPIWHADAEVDVSGLTGADAELRIDAVVSAIFAKFPGAGR